MNVAEIITLISTQGMPIVIVGVILIGIVNGMPKFFKWCGIQWEDIKNVFKSYMNEQVDMMKEVRDSNREIMAENRKLVNTVLNITDQVGTIESKVDGMSEDIKIIKDKIIEKEE